MALHQSIIIANSLSVHHDSGDRLFSDISFSLQRQVTGLVGRNGAGKSVLAGILCQTRLPDSGTVNCDCSVGYLPQLTNSNDLNVFGTVADYLNISRKLRALERIEAGSSDPRDFDILGDDWEVRNNLCEQLVGMGLPPEPFQPCSSLSGGELTRLQLWLLFNAAYEYLILDEPSNHLDSAGRQWLLSQVQSFSGGILLISHDRQLLEQVDSIMELTPDEMKYYGGNYSFYWQQKQLQQAAFDRSVASAENKVMQLQRQYQRNQEKAQQRESQGRKLRKSGSQSKLLLDGMRDSAQRSQSSRKVQFENQLYKAEQEVKALKRQQTQTKPQKMTVNSSDKRLSRVLVLQELRLAFGNDTLINLCVDYGDRLHLIGRNGCGKSTLLRTITGTLAPVTGQINCHVSWCYLDQHFSLLDEQQTVLQNLQRLCPEQKEPELRTLAAGVGFRRDRVHLPVLGLSGGERMKIALLAVSHQQGDMLLLLDEPDNHLDIESKMLLAQALRDYQGSMILISHDDSFVSEVGITGTITVG